MGPRAARHRRGDLRRDCTRGPDGPLCTRGAVAGAGMGCGMADRLAVTRPRALFVVLGVALMASGACDLVAIYSANVPWIYTGIFLPEALMFINTGPGNAAIATVVMPNMRA